MLDFVGKDERYATDGLLAGIFYMELNEISRFLSYVLRHCPEAISLTLDSQGWANIDELIQKAKANKHVFTRAQLNDAVTTNDKQRFAFSLDGQSIRAVQGHSNKQVQVRYDARQPPNVLYHGTASRFLGRILAQGLVAGSRHHVHLSADQSTAVKVGERHGAPVVLTIRARDMHQEGLVFYKADNGVWLTDSVPSDYIIDDAPY